jgi:hypothetical protein
MQYCEHCLPNKMLDTCKNMLISEFSRTHNLVVWESLSDDMKEEIGLHEETVGDVVRKLGGERGTTDHQTLLNNYVSRTRTHTTTHSHTHTHTGALQSTHE